MFYLKKSKLSSDFLLLEIIKVWFLLFGLSKKRKKFLSKKIKDYNFSYRYKNTSNFFFELVMFFFYFYQFINYTFIYLDYINHFFTLFILLFNNFDNLFLLKIVN